MDLIRAAPKTTGDLCEAIPRLDRCTVMQHLKVLEEAELVIAKRRGKISLELSKRRTDSTNLPTMD